MTRELCQGAWRWGLQRGSWKTNLEASLSTSLGYIPLFFVCWNIYSLYRVCSLSKSWIWIPWPYAPCTYSLQENCLHFLNFSIYLPRYFHLRLLSRLGHSDLGCFPPCLLNGRLLLAHTGTCCACRICGSTKCKAVDAPTQRRRNCANTYIYWY